MSDQDERQYVDYECHDHIAIIALNRPEKLNAVSDEVVRQLMAAFRRFDADAEARLGGFVAPASGEKPRTSFGAWASKSPAWWSTPTFAALPIV